MTGVVASVSAIPSRVHEQLTKCVRSLLVQKPESPRLVVVSVAKNPLRKSQKHFDVPALTKEWLDTEFTEEERKRVVLNLVEKDPGPALKYTGAAPFVRDGELVFITDDDQTLMVDVLEKMKRARGNDPWVVASGRMKNLLGTDRYLYGFSTVLLPGAAARKLAERVDAQEIPSCCQMVDDIWVSQQFRGMGYYITNARLSKEELFGNDHENYAKEDALHATTPRFLLNTRCQLRTDPAVVTLAIAAGLLVTGGVFLVWRARPSK